MQTFAGTILVLSVIIVILVQSRMPTRVGKKTNFMSSLTLGLWRDRFKYLSEPQAFILRIFRGCISNTLEGKARRQGERADSQLGEDKNGNSSLHRFIRCKPPLKNCRSLPPESPSLLQPRPGGDQWWQDSAYWEAVMSFPCPQAG